MKPYKFEVTKINSLVRVVLVTYKSSACHSSLVSTHDNTLKLYHFSKGLDMNLEKIVSMVKNAAQDKES